MIYLDPRVGSGHLEEPLRKAGLAVTVQRMKSGDIAWHGNYRGEAAWIGVEVKNVSDLVSSITTKRLTAGQIPKMLSAYDVIYLVILGRMKPSPTGAIMTGRWGKWFEPPTYLSWRAWRKMECTFRHVVGLHIVYLEDEKDLCEWVAAESSWFEEPWTSHKSHIQVKQLPKTLPNGDQWLPRELSPVELVANVMPDMGIEIARRVARKFRSPQEMCDASVDLWKTVKGIGDKTAKKAFLWLRGEA